MTAGKWLARDFIQGPFLKLCLTQKDFDKSKQGLRELDSRTHYTDGAHARCHWLKNKDDKYVCIVCMDVAGKGFENVQIACLLVHEATHVWQGHCRHIGEDSPSEEFEAYSIQSIAQRLMYSYVDQTT